MASLQLSRLGSFASQIIISLLFFEEKYYLALQLPRPVHSNIILAFYAFDCQYASFRHCPDLQNTCQTITQSANV